MKELAKKQIAVFGGIYNNYLALEAALADARRRGVDAMYCLGDLGAFGPYPNRVFPLLIDNGVQVVRGNYDDSIGRGLKDCQCGYTDRRDNEFALGAVQTPAAARVHAAGNVKHVNKFVAIGVRAEKVNTVLLLPLAP